MEKSFTSDRTLCRGHGLAVIYSHMLYFISGKIEPHVQYYKFRHHTSSALVFAELTLIVFAIFSKPSQPSTTWGLYPEINIATSSASRKEWWGKKTLRSASLGCLSGSGIGISMPIENSSLQDKKSWRCFLGFFSFLQAYTNWM